MNPIISVVTACWRREGVERVIKDVDRQSYSNIQHILVNDNSPHIDRDWLLSVCDGEKRHLIDSHINTGWSGGYARNIGVMASFIYFKQSYKQDWNNYWSYFLDDDNEIFHNRFEKMVDIIRRNPEATMIGTSMNFKTKKGIKEKKIAISPDNCDLGSFLYKYDLFFKYGFFRPCAEHRFRFDYELIKKMTNGEGDRVILVDEPTWIFNSRK